MNTLKKVDPTVPEANNRISVVKNLVIGVSTGTTSLGVSASQIAGCPDGSHEL